MTARLVTWLAIIACLQVGAVTLLLWPDADPGPGATDSGAALLPMSRDDIVHIGVTNADGDSVFVARRDDQWIIEGHALPAAPLVVEQLMDALSQPAGFPVARSDSARTRFEVDEERFQRRITLAAASDETYSGSSSGADSVTFYLGTSPGMRRVHARRGDRAAVQTIALSTFDVPATVDGWLDPSLLSLEAIERVRLGDNEWEKPDHQWLDSDPAAESDPTAADSLVSLEQVLSTLQVTGVLPAGETPDLSGQPATELAVVDGTGPVTLRFVPVTDGGEAHLYSSRFERWFTLSAYDRDRFADAIESLI